MSPGSDGPASYSGRPQAVKLGLRPGQRVRLHRPPPGWDLADPPDGLVESDDDAVQDGPQRVFRITAEGEQELAGWLRTPPDLSAPPRDELVMKVLVAMRVPGTDVHDVIQVHRRYLVELMQQWTRIKEAEVSGSESDLSLALGVDAEVFRLVSVIRWLDAADGRIKRAAGEPPSEPEPAPAAPKLKRPNRTISHRTYK